MFCQNVNRLLRWAGHARTTLAYSHCDVWQSCRRWAKNRQKHHVKRSVRACSIPPVDLEALAAKRDAWWQRVSEVVLQLETNRTRKCEEKRSARHLPRPNNSTTFLCELCLHLCKSWVSTPSTSPSEGARTSKEDYVIAVTMNRHRLENMKTNVMTFLSKRTHAFWHMTHKRLLLLCCQVFPQYSFVPPPNPSRIFLRCFSAINQSKAQVRFRFQQSCYLRFQLTTAHWCRYCIH